MMPPAWPSELRGARLGRGVEILADTDCRNSSLGVVSDDRNRFEEPHSTGSGLDGQA